MLRYDSMASSANIHKGAFQPPTTFKTTRKSWVDAVTAGIKRTSSKTVDPSTIKPTAELGRLTDSAERDAYRHVARPFLKGILPNSLLADITHINNMDNFIDELFEFCGGNEHLWLVSESPRREYSRVFAEFVVSPIKYFTIQHEGLHLKTLGKMLAFSSLSSSSEILKITLSGLPAQYGCGDCGLAQLHRDMNQNLMHFGRVVDCGIITNSKGIFAGSGYVVLEIKSSETSDPSFRSLSHLIDWSYQPFDYSYESELVLLNDFERVQVKATWASMPPFCRYCHSSEHALADCIMRRKATTCYNCNATGHISRVCPRKNIGTGKKRKTPVPIVTEPVQQVVNNSASMGVSVTSSSTSPSSNPSLPANSELENSFTEQSTPSVGSVKKVTLLLNPTRQSQRLVERHSSLEIQDCVPTQTSLSSSQAMCKHCGLQGHSRTNSKHCLKNPKYLNKSSPSPEPSLFDKSDLDIDMDDSLPDTQLPSIVEFESGTDSLLGDQPSSQ